MMVNPEDPSGGGANWSPNTSYNPNYPFANIQTPVDGADEPLITNGIDVQDIAPGTPPGITPRLIGMTQNRGNTEDLQNGYQGDVSGILYSEIIKPDNDLVTGMSTLFYLCTFYDNDLETVGNLMIDKFKNNTNNNYLFENAILNQKVQQSNSLPNFFKKFGNELRGKLTIGNRDINNVGAFTLLYRPVFNGLYNKFHGLQILINDTEYTELELQNFSIDPVSGKWYADVKVTVYDHFGLDKHDALTYQNDQSGFADWWLLQHTRGYVPFQTKVVVYKRIFGVS